MSGHFQNAANGGDYVPENSLGCTPKTRAVADVRFRGEADAGR
jgi:hypothetical protein